MQVSRSVAPLQWVFLDGDRVLGEKDRHKGSRVGASEHIENPLARLSEELVGKGLEGLLAVVQWFLVTTMPQSRSWTGEGKVVILWLQSIEGDLVDGPNIFWNTVI